MDRAERKVTRAAARAVILEYVENGGPPLPRWLRWLTAWVTRVNAVEGVRSLRAENAGGLRGTWFEERMAAHGAPEDWWVER